MTKSDVVTQVDLHLKIQVSSMDTNNKQIESSVAIQPEDALHIHRPDNKIFLISQPARNSVHRQRL